MPFNLNANEWLADLTNLCLQVLTFDNLQFTNRFGVFERQYTKYGDKIACVNAWVKDGQDYNNASDDFNNPFKAQAPSTYEDTITTKLKKRYDLSLNEDLLRGAFEDEGSLNTYLNTLIGQLRTKGEIDRYEQIVTDFANLSFTEVANFNKGITGNIDTQDGIVALYNKIITTAMQMKLPNQNYGRKVSSKGTLEVTCAEDTRIILFLTPEIYAKFMTYVNASLYNSSEIALYKWVDEIRVVDVEHNTTATNISETWGYLCTEDVYRYSTRIKKLRNQPNSANLDFNYFYHLWTNMGFTGAGQITYIGKATE